MKPFNPRKPLRLNIGDTIGIVAPAWSFDPENFKRGVAKLCKLGFKLKYSQNIFKKHWSMAGYDRERAEEINKMFGDKKIKAILCAKAGYGSIRTIPYLDKRIIRNNPKIFIGYSDITILLSYLYKTAYMVVFHGPVVSGEIHDNMNPMTLEHLFRAITQPYPLGKKRFSALKTLHSGKASGILVGGNISLLLNTIGTGYEIDTKNKILFLEDIGEDLETIDNYLMHLKLAGKFKKVRGIVFGRMLGCKDSSGNQYSVKQVLKDMLKDVKVPIIYGFPSGHRISGDVNVTLPFGVLATLNANEPSLSIDESAVV
ncbi:MAG: LD-carboxypeptidase [Candidatus Omnitrophota bacterium]